jgi:hypothetical protein
MCVRKCEESICKVTNWPAANSLSHGCWEKAETLKSTIARKVPAATKGQCFYGASSSNLILTKEDQAVLGDEVGCIVRGEP